MMHLRATVLASIMLSLIACAGDELTRDKAESLLKAQEIKEPTSDLVLGMILPGNKNYNQRDLRSLEDLKAKGEQAGLGIGTITQPQSSTSPNPDFVDLTLTFEPSESLKSCRRGEPEKKSRGAYETTILQRVAIYEVGFGEVTGIAYMDEAKTIANVEYTLIYTPTPCLEFDENMPRLGSAGFPGPRYPNKVTRSAKIRLYDDGWRVLD